jgi:putative endonuclease
MPFVYVLRSRATGRYYTGATLNLEARIQQHNSDQSISTKNRGPWDLVHHEQYSTFAEALHRERFLKTGKGRQELKRLLAEKDGSAG